MSQDETQDAREAVIAAHHRAGDHAAAATAAIRAFGGEIYRFLDGFTRSPDAADRVFSTWSEALWRGMPEFAWRSSFRTWAFAIARNAALHDRRSEQNRARVVRPVAEGSHLPELVEEIRSRTRPYLRTVVKDRFRALRDALSDDERALLELRVDLQLGWLDIARILEPEVAEDEAALKRTSARLRKRFQVLKEEIATRAKDAGLLGDGGH